jgi:hypothetical protein
VGKLGERAILVGTNICELMAAPASSTNGASATTIAETAVIYPPRRHEGTIPAVTIWRVRDDGLITNYRMFIDQTPCICAIETNSTHGFRSRAHEGPVTVALVGHRPGL